MVSTIFTIAFVNQADDPFLFLQIPWSITLCDLNCFCGANAKQSGLPIRRGSPKGELAVYVSVIVYQGRRDGRVSLSWRSRTRTRPSFWISFVLELGTR